jgi:hypothetical protein
MSNHTTTALKNTITLLEEKRELLRPLYEVRDRIRACVIVMEAGSGAFLRKRSDGGLDFFGHPGNCLSFPLSGPGFEKAKTMVTQLRAKNPDSKFYLEKMDTAVVDEWKRTEDMIARMRPFAQSMMEEA